MKEPFVFYRALDAQKGSWDGYGFFPAGDSDFVAYVADAPSGASIQTPELIRSFLADVARDQQFSGDSELGRVEMADAINRLQEFLRKRSRADAALYQSTLCVARKSGNRLFYASIGDSMLLLWRGNALYRLDEAETWNGALIARRQDDFKERQKTGALMFIGTDGAFVPPAAIQMLKLLPGDRVVLASDGVADTLLPAKMCETLSREPDEMRKDLDRSFNGDRLQDDVTVLVLDPEVTREPDLVAEVKVLSAELKKISEENSRLHRELSRATSAASRVDSLEKQVTELARKRKEAPQQVYSAEPRRAARAVDATVFAKDEKPWMWIGAAFLAGLLIAGLSLWYWNQRPETVTREAAVAPRQEPRRAVEPPAIPGSADCTYVVQSGDSLAKIASIKNLSLEALLRFNPSYKAATIVKPGMKVQVCGADR